MRKLLIFIIAFAIVITLTSCKDDNVVPYMYVKTPSDINASGGNVFDAGEFIVSVPNGWTAKTYEDKQSKKGLSGVTVYKGNINEKGIQIVYYNSDNKMAVPSESYYEDSEKTKPFIVGGRTWNGFTAKSAGTPIIVLWSGTDGEPQFLVNVWSTAEMPLTVESEAVLTVLDSIKVK